MSAVLGAVTVTSGLCLMLHVLRLPEGLRDATSGSSLGLILVIAGIGMFWLGRVRRQDIQARSTAHLARPVTVRTTEASKGGVR